MATGRINKTSVDNAQSAGKDWLLWDDKLPGFGLKVTRSGAKVFVYQYRMGGRGAKVRRYTIGKFGGLAPDRARTIAEGLAFSVAQGIDPQELKVEKARQAIDLAFSTYAERFITEQLTKAWASAHDDGASLLKRYAMPVLRNKPLPDIERKDITRTIGPIGSKAATARNLFAVLRLLFNWAVECGDLTASPMIGMKPPPSPASRDRVLTDNELALVWKASDKLGYPFGPLVRVLALTGARREEVAGLEWAELDRDGKVWRLPADRAKNGVATIVPLSSLALAEIDDLAKRTGRAKGWPRKGFLFSTTGKTSVSGFSRAKARLDIALTKVVAETKDAEPLPAWRLHDLRRTLATGMQRLGVRFEVTEALLNHVSGAKSGIAGIYQRHDWLPEKTVAAQMWADHVALVLNPAERSNVISLAEAKG